jgi:hypothetical protein
MADSHPAVRLQAALRLVRLWEIDREDFWQGIFGRLKSESNLGVIAHLASEVLGRVLHEDPQRTFEIIQDLLAREDNPVRATRIRSIICNQVSVLWVRYGLDAAHEILRGWIARPAYYADELRGVLSTLSGAVVKGLTESDDNDIRIRSRAITLLSNIVRAANTELAAFHARAESSDSQLAEVRESVQLIDFACQQLSFATNASNSSSPEKAELTHAGLDRFLDETAPLIQYISDYATPHTIYNLLQLLEKLAPVDPGRVFDLAAHALRAGTRSGYQHESMGIDLLVKMIGVFLADYKEIFEVEDRRARLIDSLEIFMEAGWPAARRLLYRLPELIQ